MTSLYDIVVSAAIGGTVLMMLLFFNGTLAEEGNAQTVKIMVQSNFTEVTRDLEFYLRKMGYGVSSGDSAIVSADSNKIKFRGDFDDDGTLDTMTVSFNPSLASGLPNKNTHILTTTLNSQKAQAINIGITRFRFWFYDAGGTPYTTYPVSAPSKIKSLKIAMNLESSAPITMTTQKYLKQNPGVYWERVLKPKNLR